MSDKPVSEMSFEEAMAGLEDVVSKLESGNVPLEESIALYEKGALYKQHCETKLKAAEEKISQITLLADGQAAGAKPVTIE